MSEKEVGVVIAVPVFVEHCFYLVLVITVIKTLRMGYVVVVYNTSILSHFLMIGREESVHLVSVAKVRGKQSGTEMRVVLVVIVAAGVGVVEVETEAQLLTSVYCKQGVDVVFTVGLVAAVVIRDICYWRQCVCEEKIVGLLHHMTVRLREDKLFRERTVYHYTALACGIVVACGVVFTVESGVEHRVHKQVLQGVGLCRDDIAELAVYAPHIQSLGNLLVYVCGVLIVLVEIAVCALVYL